MSQETSKTQSSILGALIKWDDFLSNPPTRTQSATVQGTFRKTDVENEEPNDDRCQENPQPSVYHSGHSVDSDLVKALHMVTRVQEGIP